MAKTKTAREQHFILDCSVALAWCFPDEKAPFPQAVLDSLAEAKAIVPAHWRLEVANAMLMGERRKRSTPADTANWTAFLNSLPISVDDQTVAKAWDYTLSLARINKLSTYDAAYLELALRRGLPLATLDEPLEAAAEAAGVARFSP